MPYDTTLYCTILVYYTALLDYITLYYISLYHTTLYYTTLHYTTLLYYPILSYSKYIQASILRAKTKHTIKYHYVLKAEI